jgi:hypothetical protein
MCWHKLKPSPWDRGKSVNSAICLNNKKYLFPIIGGEFRTFSALLRKETPYEPATFLAVRRRHRLPSGHPAVSMATTVTPGPQFYMTDGSGILELPQGRVDLSYHLLGVRSGTGGVAAGLMNGLLSHDSHCGLRSLEQSAARRS